MALMKVLYDFRCPASLIVFERMRPIGTDITPCKCGAVANRIIAPLAFHLDNSFPGYADSWARDHERGGKKGKGKS